MKTWKRLEHQLSSFVLFGGIMGPDLRSLSAEILFRHLYEPEYDALQALRQSSIPTLHPPWAQLMEQLISRLDLHHLTHHNEDFALTVCQEALDWSKQTYHEFERHSPMLEERQQLHALRDQQSQLSLPQWEDLLEELGQRYPEQQQNWNFYRTRLQSLGASDVMYDEDELHLQSSERKVVKSNILDDWTRLFRRKYEQAEGAYLQEAFQAYYQELSQKVDQLNSLGEELYPYYNFLGQSWQVGLKNWRRINWGKLAEYARTLQQDKELRQLADLLGRFHLHASRMEEQVLLKPRRKHEWKPNPYGKSEIIGVTYSDQLSALLPSELSMLSYPETEPIFDRKFIEKKLLTFQYRSDDLSSSMDEEEVISQRSHSEEKGPIIMCVDTSGSMFGQPERVAKALAFAILELALKEGRSAFLISFSTVIECLKLTGLGSNLDHMMDFLMMSFHGGTDLQPALHKAVEMIQTETYQKADVLVVSDFVIPHMNRQLVELIQETREEHETHFHSLYITRRPESQATPLSLFDHHWIYHLDHPGVIRQTLKYFEQLKQ